MIASKLTFSFENDGNDRERVLTALVCSFPDKVFTEMDQVKHFLYCLTALSLSLSQLNLKNEIKGMLDFMVGHSGKTDCTTEDKLRHVNFVLSSTYDLKFCVL